MNSHIKPSGVSGSGVTNYQYRDSELHRRVQQASEQRKLEKQEKRHGIKACTDGRKVEQTTAGNPIFRVADPVAADNNSIMPDTKIASRKVSVFFTRLALNFQVFGCWLLTSLLCCNLRQAEYYQDKKKALESEIAALNHRDCAADHRDIAHQAAKQGDYFDAAKHQGERCVSNIKSLMHTAKASILDAVN